MRAALLQAVDPGGDFRHIRRRDVRHRRHLASQAVCFNLVIYSDGCATEILAATRSSMTSVSKSLLTQLSRRLS